MTFAASIINSPAPSHGSLKIVNTDGPRPPDPFGPKPPADLRRIGSWASSQHVSPGGETVAFISDRGRPFSYDIYLASRKGAGVTPLGITATSKRNDRPVFMPDAVPSASSSI